VERALNLATQGILMKRTAQERGGRMEHIEDLRSRVLTVREVAAYLRVHSSTIYRMLRKRQLPAFRVGSDWRFTVDEIDRWLSDAEARGGSPLSVESKQVK
jgi:excisionase family DNA binding protein